MKREPQTLKHLLKWAKKNHSSTPESEIKIIWHETFNINRSSASNLTGKCKVAVRAYARGLGAHGQLKTEQQNKAYEELRQAYNKINIEDYKVKPNKPPHKLIMFIKCLFGFGSMDEKAQYTCHNCSKKFQL